MAGSFAVSHFVHLEALTQRRHKPGERCGMHVAADQFRPVHIERGVRFLRVGMVRDPIGVERQLFPGVFLQIKSRWRCSSLYCVRTSGKSFGIVISCSGSALARPPSRATAGDPFFVRSGADRGIRAAPSERSGEENHRRGEHAEQYHLHSAFPACRCSFSHRKSPPIQCMEERKAICRSSVLTRSSPIPVSARAVRRGDHPPRTSGRKTERRAPTPRRSSTGSRLSHR